VQNKPMGRLERPSIQKGIHVTRRLPALAFALAFATSIGAAEAGHAHFSGGVHFGGGAHFGGGGWSGGVHVSGGTSFHWSRPAYQPHYWGVRGHVSVGGYYPYSYRPYYYYYYPQYVPSYYGASYYPVEAAAGPSVTAAYIPRPELPKLGIGLFAGGVSTSDVNGNTQHDSSDVGVLGRLRLGNGGLLVEGELGKTSYDVAGASNVRVDRRLGGSLIYEFGAYNALAPYILGGIGVQQASVDGDYSTTQDFAEVGVGLRWAVSPHFHLTADIRAGSRSTVASDDMATLGTASRSIAPPTQDSGDTEDYTRARLAAILYF
jgi:Outer membrane protein beta-barrel domain